MDFLLLVSTARSLCLCASCSAWFAQCQVSITAAPRQRLKATPVVTRQRAHSQDSRREGSTRQRGRAPAFLEQILQSAHQKKHKNRQDNGRFLIHRPTAGGFQCCRVRPTPRRRSGVRSTARKRTKPRRAAPQKPAPRTSADGACSSQQPVSGFWYFAAASSDRQRFRRALRQKCAGRWATPASRRHRDRILERP